ncbi:polar amino acid transport system substrate-binding protein [Xanthobacter flavus]|uniref:Amino acid ABC transporter n=1 Tax=Xanthobacter flavus TaxID=281 RepID=A0A9W6CTT1_XANFL|nr:transporter substrate-binding domain-containing protein [Xanthobacter flavus]MDR6336425.1 polar amino acid transport system substrate-binding protein [Xanthobacter flavus]GLI25224.1 amino acid ABC transporter [Xanthobacter flavus]
MARLHRPPLFLAAIFVAAMAGALTATLLLLAPRGADAHANTQVGGTLRIGIGWLPPPETPDMRLYAEEGFDLDLAAEIGRGMGVRTELILVAPDDAVQALAAGEVDLVVVRAGAGGGLRRGARIVETGFESGLSIAMRSDRPLASWADLKGRVVCASEANRHGRDLAQRLGATVKIERAPAVTLMQVRTGECDAAIHDRVLLDPLFTKLSWQKFSATLPAVEPTSLVVAVSPGNADLAQAVTGALKNETSPERWRQRREKWASTVSFEVYRDQVAADCH